MGDNDDNADEKEGLTADPSSDDKKCKYGGTTRTFKVVGSEATEEACSKKCADDPKCIAFSGIFGQWCIGCAEELTDDHKGAKAFKKSPADDEPEDEDEDTGKKGKGKGKKKGKRKEEEQMLTTTLEKRTMMIMQMKRKASLPTQAV